MVSFTWKWRKKYFNRTWTAFYFLIRKVITVLTPFETVNEKSSSLWSNLFSDYARSQLMENVPIGPFPLHPGCASNLKFVWTLWFCRIAVRLFRLSPLHILNVWLWMMAGTWRWSRVTTSAFYINSFFALKWAGKKQNFLLLCICKQQMKLQ